MLLTIILLVDKRLNSLLSSQPLVTKATSLQTSWMKHRCPEPSPKRSLRFLDDGHPTNPRQWQRCCSKCERKWSASRKRNKSDSPLTRGLLNTMAVLNTMTIHLIATPQLPGISGTIRLTSCWHVSASRLD